jgi:hypothetical protein
MKTFTAITRSGDEVNLYSDDTFTLAIGHPDTESEETTVESLAESFTRDTLRALQVETAEFSQEWEKLSKAIRMIEPESNCARCDDVWEVQYNGENLCQSCRDKAVAEV